MDAILKLEELSKLNNIKLIGLGSKGALSKAWCCINDDIVLVKGNSLYSYEPFSEAYASILVDLSRYLERIDVKEYDVIRMIEKTKGRMYPLDDIRIELYDIEEVLE